MIHVSFGQLECTRMLELTEQHLIFVLFAEMSMSTQEVVKGHLEQSKVTFASTFEVWQSRPGNPIGGCNQ